MDGMLATLQSAGFSRVMIAPVDWRHPTPWIRLGAHEVVPPLLSVGDAPSWMRRVKPALLAHAIRTIVSARLSGGGAASDAYRRADVIVSAGGAYLGGSKPGINLIKLANLRAGVGAGRPTLTAPITVNPSSRLVRSLMRWGCASVTLFVRDAPSRETLLAMGLSSDLVPDMALRARTLVQQSAPLAARRAASGVIGWAPRAYRADHNKWGDPRAAEQAVMVAMERLLETTELRLRLIAQVRAAADDDDRLTVDRIALGLGKRFGSRIDVADDVDSLDDAIGRYASLDALVTSRMHAALFALGAGTPAVAVAYEPKVAGVMADLGLADRVLPASSEVTPDAVLRQIRRLLEPREIERTRDAFVAAQGRFDAFDRALASIATRAGHASEPRS